MLQSEGGGALETFKRGQRIDALLEMLHEEIERREKTIDINPESANDDGAAVPPQT